ncbi:MAG: Mur ligase family protein [Deltaproteobacteria bacterium]|nr:Mur ligase family protein [Deltaproteobacteria bacterium]
MEHPPASRIAISPPAVVHLVGVCGTAMGALAGLLKASGFQVTGSDAHAYPPMSLELARMGIAVKEGFKASNLDHGPDLVVVGNACRREHPEAAAARERGLAYASLPATIHDLFLAGRRSLVVAGTHGKTTTTALLAYLLFAAGRDPSVLVGGVATDFGSGHRLGSGPDFVIEGDEYDSAYFEKRPKFLSYAPSAAALTSVEHDHVDIYPTEEAYRAAFAGLVGLVDPGPLAVHAGDAAAVALSATARAEVIAYGVTGDVHVAPPRWIAAPAGRGRFELRVDGRAAGIFSTALGGRHNLRNTLAALILAHCAAGVSLDELARALPGFKGVRRRQEVIGRPRGIAVYDDFAHHPTAVRVTLEALAELHEPGRLAVAFEPRSATACRRMHQAAYTGAFDRAGLAIIAPVGRDLPEAERLDTALLAADLRARGVAATAAGSIDEVLEALVAWARPGDGVALLSNGGFGGLHGRLLEALA